MSQNYKKLRHFNQGWHSIDKIAQKIVRPLVKQKGSPVATLALDWHLIVGSFLAEQTHPEKLYFQKGTKIQGSLKLLIMASFSHEFPFHRQVLIDKINAYFGYNVINRITMRQVYELPVKKRKDALSMQRVALKNIRDTSKFKSIYKGLEDIKDEKLRYSLAELGTFLKE